MTEPYLTTLEKDGWMLKDGEVANQEHPDTFQIPPLEVRQSQQPGMYVKLGFYGYFTDVHGQEFSRGERMWVLITESRDGWYLGTLDNDPFYLDTIKWGTELWFQPRHVIGIIN